MNVKKREKVWLEKYAFGVQERDEKIREIGQALGFSDLFSVLLWNRGYRNAEDAKRFLCLEQANFHDPFLLTDMAAAVDRILFAVECHEKITIY